MNKIFNCAVIISCTVTIIMNGTQPPDEGWVEVERTLEEIVNAPLSLINNSDIYEAANRRY